MRRLLASLLLAVLSVGPSVPAQPLAAAKERIQASPSPPEGAGVPGPPRDPCGQTTGVVRRFARGRCSVAGQPSAGRIRGLRADGGGRRRGPIRGRRGAVCPEPWPGLGLLGPAVMCRMLAVASLRYLVTAPLPTDPSPLVGVPPPFKMRL